MKRREILSLAAIGAAASAVGFSRANAASNPTGTRVITLGTGTPVPDHQRAGTGVAVIYNGRAYVFDIGPGVVRRMLEAAQGMGIKELMPTNVEHLFITHLHSDHTLDFCELAATYWWRRDKHLNAIGPVGTQALVDGYYAMQSVDIHLRTSGNQPVKDPTMYKVNVTEIAQDGVVFDQDGVKVEVFTVDHGDIKPAYGYKITTPDRTVVFSGDTRYHENVIKHAAGADVLIHEVISKEGWSGLTPEWQEYHHTSHTLTDELADIANQTKPGLLVLTHVLGYGVPLETALTEVQADYDGKVVMANDLDEF